MHVLTVFGAGIGALSSNAMSSGGEVTYTAKSRPRGFSWGGFAPRAYWDLLRALVASQMKLRYKHTFVGFGWAFLNPILQMFVYAYIFGSIFSGQRANFKLFLLAGLLPWQAFSSGILASVRSLFSDRDLLKKAPFPSELLPLAAAATALVNFAIVFVVYLIYMLFRGFPALSNFHYTLAAITIMIIFLFGLSLAISALTVFFRDLEQLVAFIVWIWFFLTPVIYPLGRLGASEAKVVLALNPMAGVVTTIQDTVLEGKTPPIEPLLAAGGLSVAVFGLGWWIFRTLQYELPKAV